MNLFRSEEHARNWSSFDAASEDAIMPVADWAQVFAGPLFRKRLDPDYLSNMREYAVEFRQAFAALGKTGPFWQPER
jgi:hypothetical protein